MSGMMIGLAFLLDLALGDPPGWPHPVRWIGGLIGRLSKWALACNWGPTGRRLAGIFLWVLVVGLTYALASGLLFWVETWFPEAATLLGLVMAYTTLATRDLHDQTWRVVTALTTGDLNLARERLGLVVGRETRELTPEQIIRAVIETLAENLSDGIIAPLFYLALGGPALALAYKAINTLDSMLGYKAEPYLHLGWASARADDLANLIPARISAALIVAAAALLRLDPGGALRVWFLEGHRHPSPNSGRPEAAMAGALGVQLGGPARYHGELVLKPTLGQVRRPLTPTQAALAEKLMLTAAGLMLLLTLAWRPW